MKIIWVILLCWGTVVWAEEAESGEQDAQLALRRRAEAGKRAGDLVGEIQVRPSYGYGTGQTKSENVVNFGVRMSPDSVLDYTQYFNFHVNKVPAPYNQIAMGQDGFLRGKFQKVWAAEAGRLVLDYESRLYLPTDPSKASRGMLLGWRNYFSVTRRLGKHVALTVQEIPVLYAFDKSGFEDRANPLVENRVYFIPSIEFSKELSFSVPFMFTATRNRFYSPLAKNNDRWTFHLMIWPELQYKMGEKTSVGCSYYTNNLIKSDFTDLDLSKGFSEGVAQMVLRQVL